MFKEKMNIIMEINYLKMKELYNKSIKRAIIRWVRL
jgi:hypothetical protein